MTTQELNQEIERLRAENSGLKAKVEAKGHGRLSIKVSAKGAVSVYGLGRFPVTLYRGQMEKFIALTPEITAFIAANSDKLSVKPQA